MLLSSSLEGRHPKATLLAGPRHRRASLPGLTSLLPFPTSTAPFPAPPGMASCLNGRVTSYNQISFCLPLEGTLRVHSGSPTSSRSVPIPRP